MATPWAWLKHCLQCACCCISIAVIKRFSEHLWTPGRVKKIKVKEGTSSEEKVQEFEPKDDKEAAKKSSDEVLNKVGGEIINE